MLKFKSFYNTIINFCCLSPVPGTDSAANCAAIVGRQNSDMLLVHGKSETGDLSNCADLGLH